MSVARNTAYNLMGAVVPLAVSVVTVPFYLKAIGLDRYGLLSICLLLVGYFRLFDLGIGRATAQRIATLAGATDEARSRAFWTGAAISSLLAVVAVLIFLPIARLSLGLVDIPEGGMRAEVATAIPLLVAAVPFGLVQSLLMGSLEGRSEFLKISLINSFGSIATAVLPLAVAWFIGPELPNLIAAVLGVRTIMLVLLGLACRRAVPLCRPAIQPPGEIIKLLKFGGWTTVTGVIGPLMALFDRFAIGVLLGTAAVALYTVPYSVIIHMVVLSAGLTSALFPRFAAAEPREAEALSRDALLVLCFVTTPMVIVIAAGVAPFFPIWIGVANAAQSTPVAFLLLFGVWANSLGRIPFVRLQAQGRPDLVAKAHLAEILPYMALLYFGLVQFGIAGAALAWSLRCAADALILALMARTDRRLLGIIAVSGLLVVGAIAVAWITVPWWPVRWLMFVLLLVLTLAHLLRFVPRQVTDRLAALRRSPFSRSETS